MGLIAGNGTLPGLFARAARARGITVVAVAHRGETDPALASDVDQLTWVHVGQLRRLMSILRTAGCAQAVMAGGIGQFRSVHTWRPDSGALKILARLRHFRDDALLRAIADYLAANGVAIVAPTDYLREVLAPEGHVAGPAVTEASERDIQLGLEVASLLGLADTGQTVVVNRGHVLALEAMEGTDETLRRGGRLSGGNGGVVVKLCKPGQDERFDLPAIGPRTLETMKEAGLKTLCVEAGKTLMLEADVFVPLAARLGISVLGVRPSGDPATMVSRRSASR